MTHDPNPPTQAEHTNRLYQQFHSHVAAAIAHAKEAGMSVTAIRAELRGIADGVEEGGDV